MSFCFTLNTFQACFEPVGKEFELEEEDEHKRKKRSSDDGDGAEEDEVFIDLNMTIEHK